MEKFIKIWLCCKLFKCVWMSDIIKFLDELLICFEFVFNLWDENDDEFI